MKRIISMLLAILLVLSTVVFSLTSCEKEETPEENKTQSETKKEQEVIEGDIFSERAAVDDELPDFDFGGRELRFVSHGNGGYVIPQTPKNEGNLLIDAQHDRNDAVQNRFNVKLVSAFNAPYYEVNEWVSKAVLSGADEFDVFCNHGHTAGMLVVKNLFLNWYDIPYIDFSKPWWAKSCANELTYDGKCILAVSDFVQTATFGAYCMIFNKSLANAYDFGNLYDVVLSGDWTFDYFYDLIKDIYVDNDASGDRNDGDFYGFSQGNSPNMWLWAFDNPIVQKDADGVPVIAFKTDKINDIVSKIYDLCVETKGVYYIDKLTQDLTWNPFLTSNCIISVSALSAPTSEGLRNFEDDYGLLPFPKLDENQKDYKTMALGEHPILAVPKTVKDTEFVGVCVEALSAEAYKTVMPTYYEIALKTRYLRDNESKEVLDIIIDGRIFDFGYLYNGAGFFTNTITNVIRSGNKNFESYYQSHYNAERTTIKKVVKVFDKLG